MQSDGIAQFIPIEPAVTHELPLQQKHGNLVAKTDSGRRIRIDVQNLDDERARFGQPGQLLEHFIA